MPNSDRVVIVVSPCGVLFRIVFFAVVLSTLGSVVSRAGEVIIRGFLQSESEMDTDGSASLVLLDATDGRKILYGDLFVEAQLRDRRLAEREWELEGSLAADGRFEIHKLFTVKDGQRHRITYYCEICHIYTHEPGRCMCCQEETELREVPES
jgi:hypothetical protein